MKDSLTPWFLSPTHLPTLANQLAMRNRSTATEPVSKRPSHDIYGNEIEQMRMVGTSAVIPVKGTLLKGATGADKQWGFTGYEDIHDDLETAAGKAKSIYLDISSPGGTAVGAAQLAQHVKDVNAHVPVYSFTNSLQCSAAEYLSGACEGRFATSDAIVGSIGTIMATVTFQKMLEERGIEAHVFTSGKFKGAGHPYKDLTPEQEENLQSFVDTLGNEFKSWMSSHRKGMAQASMQGQIFTGRQGSENGLIDMLVPSLSAVMQLFG